MSIDDILYKTLYTPNHFDNASNRDVWCIGDVHGCLDQYKELVSKIKEKDPDACIIQLGDLIDRGPADLYELFVFTEQQLITTCLGNHEYNFLVEWFRGKYCRSKVRQETHRQFLSYDVIRQRYILDCMLSMKNYITVEVDGKVWTLSHAPIRKGFVESNDCGSANVYCMSTKAYTSETVYSVHGHMHWDYLPIEDQLTYDKTWFNIDGGCCYNGDLIALSLKTLDYLKVPGAKYATHGKH